jgi:hypothetical protein
VFIPETTKGARATRSVTFYKIRKRQFKVSKKLEKNVKENTQYFLR